jgi:hypothetical protein
LARPNKFSQGSLGDLYNLRARELQTTDTDLRTTLRSAIQRIKGTYERAIANDAQTGSSLTCPAGYIAPAAIGKAARLYMIAQI